MALPTNDIKFNVKNGLAVGASGFEVINPSGEWVGASGAGQSPYGATGARGETGATGAAGTDGASGITGNGGATGATGILGFGGATGVTGQDGATGIVGATGLAGATGWTGESGQQGPDGAQGPEGSQGQLGETGLQGATGGFGGLIGGAGSALDPSYKGSGIALSNNNLTVEDTGPGYYTVLGTTPIGSQKTVFSFHYNYDDGGDYLNFIGLAARSMGLNNALGATYEMHSVGLSQRGYFWWYGSGETTDWTADSANWVSGNIIDVAVDPTNNAWWVRVNGGNWNNNVSANPATNTGGYSLHALDIDADLYPAITVASENGPQGYTLQESATYSLPSGFTFYGGAGAYQANRGVIGATGTTGETGATGVHGARYHTTSTTTLNLDTGATGLVVVDNNLNYSQGQIILIADGGGKHIHATVDSYDSNTKTLNFTPIDHVGTGSASSWEINLDGAEGIVGASGVTGQGGATGPTGATGSQGFGGHVGATGADGEQGVEGLQGATGVPGATGSLGEQGVIGEQGFTGADGDQGARGQTGLDGDQGINGDQGYQGVQGATGADGATGIQGGNGSAGGNAVYGDTIPSITWSAPANTLSLGLIATDRYRNHNNDLQFDGWNGVVTVENGGGNYWEYIGLSTKSNSTSVSNDTATIANWDYQDNQYWIAMVETLKGVSSVPYNDDYWTNYNQYSDTAGETIYMPAYSIAVLMSGTESPGALITSIDSTNGITWVKRSSITAPGTNAGGDQSAEVWYAINNTSSGVNTAVTVHYDNSFDDQAMVISTWMNVDLSDPWDGSGSGATNTGYTGATGATGPQGPEGNQGYDGATGVVGETGATGPHGATGWTGEQGQTGETGTDGASGVTGEQGQTGETGVDGASGITGETGATGISGATGYTGSTGVTGETGDFGATGSHGLRFRATTASVVSCSSPPGNTTITLNFDSYIGYDYSYSTGQDVIIAIDHQNYLIAKVLGYDSIDGSLHVNILENHGSAVGYAYVNLNGAVGWIGASGATGYIGATGYTGATGVTGADGDQGVDGASGITGEQGQTGRDGATGVTGATGTQGITGEDGATGVTGSTGTQGVLGSTGSEGVYGASGAGLVYGSTAFSSTTQQTLDIFAANQVGSAKYLIQGLATGASGVQATELFLTQNSSGAYVTEYATVKTNNSIMDVSVSTDGSVVSLKVTPLVSNTQYKFVRESIQGRIGGTTVEDPNNSNIFYSFTHADNPLVPVGKAYVYPNEFWYNQINFTSLIGTSVTFDSAGIGPQNPAIGTIDSWDGGTLVVTMSSGTFTTRTDLDKITYGY